MFNDRRYPLSAKYDPDWLIQNELGSHCLWLMEGLVRDMDLKPGMRVLDLGCGKALTPIFLAKEFGVQVWAVDLRVNPTDSLLRIREAGVEDRVFPLRADARNLPFAEGFFDAVVSINSFQFYATDDEYLRNCLIGCVKPGSQIGFVAPGLYDEFTGDVPDYLETVWNPSFFNWHSAAWWRWHWEKTRLVRAELADNFPDREGFGIFWRWEEIMDRQDEPRLVHIDNGRNITFVRVIARRIG